MQYQLLYYNPLDRYFTRLTQVGYFPDNGTYNLVALSILDDFTEFLSEEDIKQCKLDSIIDYFTDSTCLTSGINNTCPDISNIVSILTSV